MYVAQGGAAGHDGAGDPADQPGQRGAAPKIPGGGEPAPLPLHGPAARG